MPTSKPRITVTLTKEQYAILRQISAAGGQSMSGVISEFMLMAQPVLERMAVEFQQLKQQREADHQLVVEMLSKLHAKREGKEVSALSRASSKVSLQPIQHPTQTIAAEPDALQFCASVDFVRPDKDMADDSFGDDVDVDSGYAKQKRSTSLGTNTSAKSAKGTPRRAKK
jgi:uncharacterized protein (DUF1778 family)